MHDFPRPGPLLKRKIVSELITEDTPANGDPKWQFKRFTIKDPGDLGMNFMKEMDFFLIPMQVGSIVPGGAAANAGLKQGMQVIAINGDLVVDLIGELIPPLQDKLDGKNYIPGIPLYAFRKVLAERPLVKKT